MRRVLFLGLAFCLTSCSTTGPNSTAPTNLSANDQRSANELARRIVALSPTIRPDEAQRLSETAYLTVRRLAVEYQMTWPSGVQNYLIASGQRKRGYCFHWAEDIISALAKLHLQTIELHWAEAFPNTSGEHNVPVATAIGQPYWQGIMLDGWRYAGVLYTSGVKQDMHLFEWHENKAQFARVWARALAKQAPTPAAPTTSPAIAPVSSAAVAPASTTR
ncbi:MAG: hypothetical protein ACXWFY_08170 [Chthoniobacterales bacterium]